MREEKLDFWLKHNMNICFVGRHGVGKCLGRGTPVLMYDGSIYPVEAIIDGDMVMGPDSLPRLVCGTTSGRDQMYKIVPKKGDPFICNSVHILTFKMSSAMYGYKKGDVFDMPLDQFLSKSANFRRRSMLIRSGVEFSEKPAVESPYLVGVWLGDGHKSGSAFTATEYEVLEELCDYVNANQMVLTHVNPGRGDANIDYRMAGVVLSDKTRTPNRFRMLLREFDLLYNKHIPLEYLTASRSDRQKLLAGLIDTDGELVHNCLSITQKSKRLAKDILFLARSLGLAAYDAECVKTWTHKGVKKSGTYTRITISGDIDQVPCRLMRKHGNKRRQTKDALCVGIKSISPLGENDYFGFTLDGDGRFLLGDFTVTHNTAMVNACFERAGLTQGETYLYFSGSTLDPWVDFVGVPKEHTINKIPDHLTIIRDIASVGYELAIEWVIANWKLAKESAKKIVDNALGRTEGITVLELVRPKVFALDQVQAIFVDEYNRAPKKVRNAVMELIQFKSINGKKFPQLKAVWTAINPEDDDEYDVEKLDPAQQDRFVVSIVVPYKPNEMWFTKRYGDRVGRAAIQWWANLNAEEQKLVSPRRLEYALNMWEVKGDMRDVLPMSSNVPALMQSLNVGPISAWVEELFKSKDTTAAKLFLSNENSYNPGIKVICESEAMMEFFLPLLSKEKISALLSDNERARRLITSVFGQYPIFQDVMRDILQVNQNKTLVKAIRRALTDNTVLATGFGPSGGGQPAPPHFVKSAALAKSWSNKLVELKMMPVDTTAQRTKLYNEMVATIPEKMTGDEAVITLEILNGLMAKAWVTTLTTADGENALPLVINMTNHSIAQLAIGKNMSWTDITATFGMRMKNLLDKIKEADLAKKLFTPSKS